MRLLSGIDAWAAQQAHAADASPHAAQAVPGDLAARAADARRWVASSLLSCGCHSMELMLSSRHDRLLQE